MEAGDAPGDPDPSVADRDLRSALKHAVNMAAIAARRRPPVPYPAALRRFASQRTLSAAALAAVREAVSGDPAFRRHLAATASADLVDEVGRQWLAGTASASSDIAPSTSVAAPSPSPRSNSAAATAGELRAEQKRRTAAEAGRDRAEAALAAQREKFAAERAALQQRLADSEASRVRAERAAVEAQSQAAAAEKRATRHERAAESAGDVERRAAARVAELEALLSSATSARDAALADRAMRVGDELDRDRLRSALSQALAALGEAEPGAAGGRSAAASGRASSGAAAAAGRAGRRREPIAMPGGRRADSPEGVEHLFRVADVRVIIDGYNVAMLGWPEAQLAAQRDKCIAALETLAARWGTSIIVVFDGADVRGASTRARRQVTVTFSAPGQLADDAIRDIVGREPLWRPLVVVTNDNAIRADVRAAGANVLSSDALLAAMR